MQLGLCPEAASHLQELKDNLIAISNELLDNIDNLSSAQIAKLRQDRCAFLLESFPICDIFIFNYTNIQYKERAQRFHHCNFFFLLYNYAAPLYLEK